MAEIASPSAVPAAGDLSWVERLRTGLWLPWAGCFLALTLVQAAASLGAAAYIAFVFLVAALNPVQTINAVWRSLPLLILCILALASVLWSEVPALSLRHALQYAVTAAGAICFARALPPRHFFSALMLSTLVSLLLSLLVGEYRYDGVSRAYAFIGIFGSKNFLAFVVTVSILTALLCAVDALQPITVRLLAGIALVIAPLVLARTHSATSFVTSALCAGVFLGCIVFRRMPGSFRAILVLYAAIVVGLSAVVFEELLRLAEIFIQDVLGKDTTLTGRTYLWDRAGALIREVPVLGRGFQAFWRQDSPDPEALWRYFQITGRGGFHFHNTYVQTTVDLGYIGFTALVALLVGISGFLLAWYVRDRSIFPSAGIALFVLLVIRSFVEVDITFQFQLGTILFYTLGYYASVHGRSGA